MLELWSQSKRNLFRLQFSPILWIILSTQGLGTTSSGKIRLVFRLFFIFSHNKLILSTDLWNFGTNRCKWSQTHISKKSVIKKSNNTIDIAIVRPNSTTNDAGCSTVHIQQYYRCQCKMTS